MPLLAMSPEGVLYLGNRDYLYAVRSESPGLGNSAWPKFHRDGQNTGRVLAVADRKEEPARTRYRVSGRIVLPDGAPVAGALIGPWEPGPLVYSGIQGGYEMELEPGEYTFRIKLPGIGSPVQKLAVVVSGDTRVDVVLEAELPPTTLSR